MILKELSIPIYDCGVRLIVAEDQEEFEEQVLEVGYSGGMSGAGGITLHYPDNPSYFCVVFERSFLSPGNIAHEAGHLAIKICDHIGIEYDPHNQEPFAYLLGFLVDLIHQSIYESDN